MESHRKALREMEWAVLRSTSMFGCPVGTDGVFVVGDGAYIGMEMEADFKLIL